MKLDEFLTRIDVDDSKPTIYKCIERPFNNELDNNGKEKKVTGLGTETLTNSGNVQVSGFIKTETFPKGKTFVLEPEILKKILEDSTKIDIKKYTLIGTADDNSRIEWNMAGEEDVDKRKIIETDKVTLVNPKKFAYRDGIKLEPVLIQRWLRRGNLLGTESFEFTFEDNGIVVIAHPGAGENVAVIGKLPIMIKDYHCYYDSSIMAVLKKLTGESNAMIHLGEQSKDKKKFPPIRISISDAESSIDYYITNIMAPKPKENAEKPEPDDTDNTSAKTEAEPEEPAGEKDEMESASEPSSDPEPAEQEETSPALNL